MSTEGPKRGGDPIRAIRAIDNHSEGDRPPTNLAGSEVAAPTPPPITDQQLETALKNSKPIYNAHTQGLAGDLIAKENNFKNLAGDIRSKIDALEAEYTDIMLAEAGIRAALQAMQNGAAG